MKSATRRPAKRRSQTHAGTRPRRSKSYVALPLNRVKLRLRLPSLGAQRTAAAFAVFCLGIMLLALLVLPDYKVASVVIRGNQGTSPEVLQDALAFAEGRNVFLLRTSDVEAVATKLPGVIKASASIRLPDTLVVQIQDTRPEVMWLAGNQTLWVDINGAIRDLPPNGASQTLTIRDVSGKVYDKGGQVDKSVLGAANELVMLMPSEIQAFEFQRDGELTVVSNSAWRALFSTRDPLPAQVEALRKTLASKSALYVDVRAPSAVVYR